MTELTADQRALAEAMSDVSERAYCAGWMDGTEYEVWRLLQDGGDWGWVGAEHLTSEMAAVKAAFERAKCWIVWDDEREEQPIAVDDWRQKYDAWVGRRS